MKIIKDFEGTIYAVAIATGTSATGDKYANVLVSKEPKTTIRSSWSLFLDLNDQEMLEKLNITDIEDFQAEDGSRKVTPIQPVTLFEGVLATVQHAPYGIYRQGSDKPRWIYSTSVVKTSNDSLQHLADNAVRRAYERAEVFAKGETHLEDYRKYVVFAMSREELEKLLQDAEELE